MTLKPVNDTDGERMGLKQIVSVLILLMANRVVVGDEPAAIDAKSLHRKVLCGYQGWFRCPGDAANLGWRHWSRDGQIIDSTTASFEMWPDMSELDDDEKYAAPGFNGPDGKPASLFSSVHSKTVERHFRWMKETEIDGVFLQQFLVDMNNPSVDMVLENVRQSSRNNRRIYALCYDMSGMPNEKLFDALVSSWKKLVDEKRVTADTQYLHHNGKPLLFIWGFYPDRFSPELAHQIIDFFKDDPRYSVTLVGGCQWSWRTETNPEWAKAFRRFDVISPWNVGNSTVVENEKRASTDYWKDDLAETKRIGMEYLPVIYPGFGWTNLKGVDASDNDLPRRGGEFFWQQFSRAAELKIDMAYVAMFDEVDEGTAIFKVTNSPPGPGHFKTYDGFPTDWYLRLTGEGTKLIRGERKNSTSIPIKP